MKKAIDIQIGGDHYKKMPFQPVMLFAKTHCTAFQANIWKYISRYKFKNGKEDIEKCIHYAKLAKELKCEGHIGIRKIRMVNVFCYVNKFSEDVSRIVMSAGFDRYDDVIKGCELLLQKEYSAK